MSPLLFAGLALQKELMSLQARFLPAMKFTFYPAFSCLLLDI
jgi:hypothetical protein